MSEYFENSNTSKKIKNKNKKVKNVSNDNIKYLVNVSRLYDWFYWNNDGKSKSKSTYKMVN